MTKPFDNNKKDAHVVYVDDPTQHLPGLPKLANDLLFDRNRFVVRVFDLMAIGLGVTAATAWAMAHSAALPFLLQHRGLVTLIFVVELVLVYAMAGAARRMSPTTAFAAFTVYAVLNGVTLSPIFAIYTKGSIVGAFVSTGVTFGSMSILGYATKRDLTSMGSLLIMSLWGLLAALLINVFMQSSVMDTVLSIVGIFIFIGLTAFDAQKIKRIGEELGQAGDHPSFTGIAVVCALELYLDFLNLFIRLLQVFGKLKDGELPSSSDFV